MTNQQSVSSPTASPQSPTPNSNSRIWMLLTVYVSLAVLVFSLLAYYSMFDTIVAAVLGLTGAYLAKRQGSKRYVAVGLLGALSNIVAYVLLEAIS